MVRTCTDVPLVASEIPCAPSPPLYRTRALAVPLRFPAHACSSGCSSSVSNVDISGCSKSDSNVDISGCSSSSSDSDNHVTMQPHCCDPGLMPSRLPRSSLHGTTDSVQVVHPDPSFAPLQTAVTAVGSACGSRQGRSTHSGEHENRRVSMGRSQSTRSRGDGPSR
jgi:hypothetical protein